MNKVATPRQLECAAKNLRSWYEEAKVQVEAESNEMYGRLVETFRLVGRTSASDLELCRELARHSH